MPEKQSDQARTNRAYWDRTSDDYQRRHREFIGRPDPRWGVWQIRESELHVLGEVDGKDVLELGCGAAQWSILLAKQGARPVGLDNSARQLEHARERLAEYKRPRWVEFVQALPMTPTGKVERFKLRELAAHRGDQP